MTNDFDPAIPMPTSTASDEPQQPTRPTPQMPGRRFGGTVVLSDGGSRAEYYDHSAQVPPSLYTGRRSEASYEEPVTFYAEGTNQRILAKDVKPTDLVDLGGRIGVTTVGSALHNGWLVDRGGTYVKAGEAAASGKPAAAQESNQARRPQSDQPSNDDDDDDFSSAERNYLHHADEAYIRDFAAHLGEDTFEALEAFLTSGEEIPNRVMAQVAAKFGGDQQLARQAIGRAVAPLYQQAVEVVEQLVGPGNAERVFTFAQTNREGKEIAKRAMQAHSRQRSTAGYVKLARAYLADLAKKDPAAVVEGIRNGGGKARIVNGEVVVNLGKRHGGEVSFVAAMKAGLI